MYNAQVLILCISSYCHVVISLFVLQVECLLDCAFHGSDLSPVFLEEVAKWQQNHDNSEEGGVGLSYQAKLNLWTIYLPSYKQQVRPPDENVVK